MLLAVLPLEPVYVLLVLGFVVAVVGHLAGDRRVVAIGLGVLFAATALLFLGAYQSYRVT